MAIMADIEVIALNDNMLTGSIPSFIGVLDDVRYMSLKGNRLSGAIPSEIGHCFRLTDLHLQNNRLTGEIPSQLGKLDLLSKLSLQKNIFSNITMPAEICNLVKIGDISALSADCSDTSKVQCDCCHSCFPLS
jgi:Leucine-rich repeat (LRR) protein